MAMRFSLVQAVLLSTMLVMALMPLVEEETEVLSGTAAQPSTSANTTGWLASAGGYSAEQVNAMVPLEDGGLIVAGSFEQNIDFFGDVVGFSSQDSNFGVDFFIGWIDGNGNWTNTTNGSSPGLDSIANMAMLSDGTVVMAGTFCDMTLGDECNMTLGELDPISKSAADNENAAFVAAMTQEGDWMWAKAFSNEYQIGVVDLMVSQNDDIHLALLHRGELVFENQSSPASVTQEAVALNVMNSQGDFISIQTVFSTNTLDDTGKLCKDGLGMTYFATSFLDMVVFGEQEVNSTGGINVAVAQYTPGSWSWVAHAGGGDDSTVTDCASMPGGGLTLVGDYLNDMRFGDIDLPNAVWIDFYLAQLSSSGTWMGASGFGGGGVDRAKHVAMTAQGDAIVLGETSGSLTLGEFILADLDGINDGNHLDVFLAQRQANGPWDWAVNAGGSGNDVSTDLVLTSMGSPVVAFVANNDGVYGPHAFDQTNDRDLGVWMYETDLDLDGVLDGMDNCPKLANPDQANYDGDAFGDLCDDDDDDDGVSDLTDDCPTGEIGWLANANTDHDGDGCRDLNEDLDDDEDGVFDTNDLCPTGPVGWVSTPENDIETDGCADIDTDGDGFVDQADNCPAFANPTQADLDNDGVGDGCDADKDGDGIPIPADNCPNDLNSWISFTWNDYDGDGCLDETMDDDDDDDGVLDVDDACVLGEKNWIDQAEAMDHDGDGCADATEDDDDDNDGKADGVDRCPKGLIGVAQAGQDMDDDGCIDAVEDDDDDQDGVLDPVDLCPRSNPADQIASNGCSEYQLDDDDDGVVNAYDYCQNTPFAAVVDEQGCVADIASSAGEEETSGWGLATWLFIAAGIIVGWAVYSSNQRPGPALPKSIDGIAPPPRPAGMDEEA
ncbi:MAG: thrombospondin type 3 repeat-containing protein [Candidatus Poseidonia sp.]|jgi:hypothetical protein|nr:thrombospondin type 3 repeat-containing protein [Poseidonia sp.]